MERRLAVIVAADVVGYSALMERDEAGTFERLKAGRKELFEPEIERHHGRIFKLMGDGLLAEFSSVVDAVECAVALQRGLAERNATFPEEDKIQVRIGVNLGEVIVEGEDRFGEGVNVAARLEELAGPGDIYVSGKVAKEVGKRLALDFEPMGDQKVKNLTEPVAVYRVRLEGDDSLRFPGLAKRRAGERRARPPHWRLLAVAAVFVIAIASAGVWFRPWKSKFEPDLPLPEKPSIAVMPFTNMSGDPQQDYFADGMTDNLITDLSQVSGLFVIARNSTFSYKGKTIDPRQVARELGVRYVLEGSIQRAGDAVRINAQLIDATTDGHAWADRYDGTMADVFALQDKVTHSIASALAISLSGPEEQLLAQQETKVPAAYDAFLRGWGHYRHTTPEDFAKSIPYFEEAIRLDPEYGRAYAALAMVYILANDWNWLGSLGISSLEARSRAQNYLAEAEKRPTSTSFQARANLWIKTAAEPGMVFYFYKKAIALDPSDSWNFAYLAWAQIGLGRQSDAMSNIKTAMRLDPHYPPVFLHILGIVQLSSGDYEQAVRSLNQATKLNPDNEFTLIALAAAYGYLDRKQEAERAVARYNDLRAKRGDIPLTLDTMPQIFSAQYSSDTVLRKGLRLAGVPERLNGSEFAVKNRLRATEIRNLLFGHRLRGHTVSNGNEHAAEITPEGLAKITGDWGTMAAATTSFKDDEVCFAEAAGSSFCAAMLRNPAGTRPAENEYIWLDATGAFPFSRIE
jgi:TolB-like protein/class 3 adenylate cyclase/tetratricopeptide (TPR) repeat protein